MNPGGLQELNSSRLSRKTDRECTFSKCVHIGTIRYADFTGYATKGGRGLKRPCPFFFLHRTHS